MLGMGISEMVLIAGIALVIIGPEKFPEFAKICMRTIRDLRSYVEEAKDDLRKELKPLKKEIDDVKRYDPEKYIDALTDSRDESHYYDAGYGQQTSESDLDTEAYDMYGASDKSSGTPEQQPGNSDSAETDSSEEASPESDEAASETEPASPDDDDVDIPKPMDG